MKQIYSIVALGIVLSCSGCVFDASDNMGSSQEKSTSMSTNIPIPETPSSTGKVTVESAMKQGTQPMSLSSLTIPTTSFEATDFSVIYPITFTPRPQEPRAGRTVDTSEVYFTSSEGSVELYVGVGASSYGDISESERVISQDTSGGVIRDEKGAYTRSYQREEREGTVVTFGMWYRDEAAYARYVDVYEQMKNSFLSSESE